MLCKAAKDFGANGITAAIKKNKMWCKINRFCRPLVLIRFLIKKSSSQKHKYDW
jgi:hypothetical protein